MIDFRVLRPAPLTETVRQARLELLRTHGRDPGIVRWISRSLAQVRNPACIPVPVGVRETAGRRAIRSNQPACKRFVILLLCHLTCGIRLEAASKFAPMRPRTRLPA